MRLTPSRPVVSGKNRHNGVGRAGARTRVLNLLCFGNSKLFFSSHLHESFPRHVPVAVHVSYHERPAPHMRALLARYRRGESGAMTPLLIERISGAQKKLCSAPRRFSPSAGSEKLVGFVVENGPWEWSGTPPFTFKAQGELQTPWGPGRWGPLGDDMLFADFVGSRHNLQFDLRDMSRFTSSRCGDGEPVVGKLQGGSRSRSRSRRGRTF